jgi:hypothetical protein
MKTLLVGILLLRCACSFAQPPNVLGAGRVIAVIPWPFQSIDFVLYSGLPQEFADPCSRDGGGFNYGFCGPESLTRDFYADGELEGNGTFSFSGNAGISTVTQVDAHCFMVRFPVIDGILITTDFGEGSGLTAQYSQTWCSINGADHWAAGDLTVETPDF